MVEVFYMMGKFYDCGDKLGYMKVFVIYGVCYNIEGENFIVWLK